MGGAQLEDGEVRHGMPLVKLKSKLYVGLCRPMVYGLCRPMVYLEYIIWSALSFEIMHGCLLGG